MEEIGEEFPATGYLFRAELRPAMRGCCGHRKHRLEGLV
jgi:hypothetical protein